MLVRINVTNRESPKFDNGGEYRSCHITLSNVQRTSSQIQDEKRVQRSQESTYKTACNLKLSANRSWYERKKSKRLFRPTDPLELLQLDVIESMRHKLDNKNCHQWQQARNLTHP